MNIKKILALVLALVMVVGMVAACGEVETTTEGTKATDATTKATDATTEVNTTTEGNKTTECNTTPQATKATTTQATVATTTEAPKPDAPAQAVVYIPVDVEPVDVVTQYDTVSDAMYEALYKTVETAEAVNIATGEKVTVANVTTGHLYLVETKDGVTTAVTDLGRAITYVNANRQGKKNGFSDTALMTGVKTGTWAFHFDDCVYLMNAIDSEKVNAALAKYEEFVGYYEEVVNCNLWGDDIADSPVKEYWDAATAALAEGETVTALSYTYYYDVATDTYVVFVTDNPPGSLVYGTSLNYDDFKASPEYPEAE